MPIVTYGSVTPTFTPPITVQGATPSIRLSDLNQTDPTGRFDISTSGGLLYIRLAATAAWGSFTNLVQWSAVGAPTVLISPFALRAATPSLQVIDTAQVDPSGNFLFISTGNSFRLRRALTAAFATVQDVLLVEGTGNTNPGRISYTGPFFDFADNTGSGGTVLRINTGTFIRVLGTTTSAGMSFQGFQSDGVTSQTVFQILNSTDQDVANFPSAQFVNRPVYVVDIDLAFAGQTANRFIRSTNPTGINTAGQNLTIRPQLATGNAATGTLVIQTGIVGASGTAVQTAATAMSISPTTLVVNLNNAAQLSWTDGAFALQKATTISTTVGALTLAPVSGSNLAFTVGGTANIAVTMGTGVFQFQQASTINTALAAALTINVATGGALQFGSANNAITQSGSALLVTANGLSQISMGDGAFAFQKATSITTTVGALTLAPVSGSNLAFTVAGAGSIALTFGTGTITGAVFSTFTMADVANIVLNATTGTIIGTAITQKLGFYGAVPIAQRAGAAQAAVATTASTQTTPFGYTTAAQADGIVTLVNELRAWAVAQGFIKGAA